MTLMIYPSGKRVKVAHDDRGRLSALQRVNDSGGVQEPYLSGINYRADGLISGQTLGDGTTESFTYSDDRLQLTRQKVMKGGSTLLDLSYGYGALAGQMGNGSTAGNSGQLVTVTGTINGRNRNQTFTYDNVGRLVTATGLSGQPAEGTPWARRHDYDRYGNRTKVWDATSGGNQLQNTMIGQANGMTTNRIASVNGTTFNYDASGNVTWDGARSYTYDAENRLVSVGEPGSESYGYDAMNHRVKKVVGGVVTHYIWEDQVIAEYERGGSSTQATGTRYYHQDRLSTRVITDGAGNVKGTTDHLPFGEEIGLSGEGEKHKFTTYERDNTGNDYAVNRHYSSAQGRFNQVDPLGMGASSLADPQSLNLYSYVQSDSVNRVDPTGRNGALIGAGIAAALISSLTIRDSVTITASLNSNLGGFGGVGGGGSYGMLLGGGEDSGGGGGGQDGGQRGGEQKDLPLAGTIKGLSIGFNKPCREGQSLLTINGNSIEKTADGGASLKLEKNAAGLMSSLMSRVAERDVSIKADTTLSLNLIKDAGGQATGFTVSSKPGISLGIPGPNISVKSVQFDSKGVVTKVDADYAKVLDSVAEAVVKKQLNNALGVTFNKAGGGNLSVLRQLLNTVHNPTGPCFNVNFEFTPNKK